MFCVELGGSYSPRRHWCFKQPDFGSKGPGPAYRLLMTFGNADDLAYEFATYCIATPGRPTQHSLEVCIETLIRSLREAEPDSGRITAQPSVTPCIIMTSLINLDVCWPYTMKLPTRMDRHQRV